ncbi:hypothetical protein ACJ73_08348 [Blastomyces percursus]|uniref:F-box domain-containing protein n=1 Tax=Blastomyces percursus TaxID=1658174 RepID=A0A1J9PVJ0_9EURO|nr:hypothetical protein ACJ73_08348 [Blastomyces percursus]
MIPPTFTGHRCTPEQKGQCPESASTAITPTTSRQRAHSADRPAGEEEKRIDEETFTRPAKRSRSSPHILTLPAEVHLHVLELLNAGDLYRLDRQTRDWKVFRWVAGSLGRNTVVCIGDETSADEDAYPQGLLDEDDGDELKEGLTAAEWEDGENEEEEESVFSGPATLYDLARSRYQLPSLAQSDNPGVRYLQPHSLKSEYVSGPFIRGIGFGEVILSRICWSTSGFISMENKHTTSIGRWAGHRLDIVPLDVLSNEDNSWKDIGDEVGKEIAEIWEANLGENWREQIIKREG